MWIIAPAGILSCAYLMYFLPWRTWERLLIWLAIGVASYYLYGYRNSKLAKRARGEQV